MNRLRQVLMFEAFSLMAMTASPSFISCKTSPNLTATKEFQNADMVDEPDAEFRDFQILPDIAPDVLATVRQVRFSAVPSKDEDYGGKPEYQRTVENPYDLPEDLGYGLTISLQRPLTQKEFDILTATFGAEEHQTFDPQKIYVLQDFLNPAAQSMYGRRFKTQREQATEGNYPWLFAAAREARSEFGEISTQTNCWATAWETLRKSSQELTLFFADEGPVQKQLEDDSYSSVVKTFSGRTKGVEYFITNPNEASQGLKPLDLLLFYQKITEGGRKREALVHVANFISPGIIFEKSNPGSDYPVRFAWTRDTVHYLTADGDSPQQDFKSMRVVVRRFNGGGKSPLPNPRVVFSMENDPGIYAEFTVKPKLDDLRKFSLHDELGMGGGVLYSSVFRIVDVKIAKNLDTGRFEPQSSNFSPEEFWLQK